MWIEWSVSCCCWLGQLACKTEAHGAEFHQAWGDLHELPAPPRSLQLYAFATEYPGSYMDSKDDGVKVSRGMQFNHKL